MSSGIEHLLGMVVSWTNLPDCEHYTGRNADHGAVVAVLGKHRFLVRAVDPHNQPPTYHIVLHIGDPTLMYFEDEAQWRRWMSWLDTSAEAEPDTEVAAQSMH